MIGKKLAPRLVCGLCDGFPSMLTDAEAFVAGVMLNQELRSAMAMEPSPIALQNMIRKKACPACVAAWTPVFIRAQQAWIRLRGDVCLAIMFKP